ncbi:MAG: hypothetical protein QME50_00085 [Candidatus Bathyarchaeota archaeon]|nr:hypothetical protein [Candidatus Bathyarchaeota archaeon]
MRKSWRNRNVDLELLAKCIGDFFKEKDFEAVKGKIANGYQILADDSPHFKLDGYVNVTIEGRPSNFVISLDLCGGKESGFKVSSWLMTMFGGGYFFLRKLKSQEDWVKFEKEFWRYVENSLPSLVNSAKSSPCGFEQ